MCVCVVYGMTFANSKANVFVVRCACSAWNSKIACSEHIVIIKLAVSNKKHCGCYNVPHYTYFRCSFVSVHKFDWISRFTFDQNNILCCTETNTHINQKRESNGKREATQMVHMIKVDWFMCVVAAVAAGVVTMFLHLAMVFMPFSLPMDFRHICQMACHFLCVHSSTV